MRMPPQLAVYLLGLVPLAFVYERFKAAVDNGFVFVACGIGYLIALRLIGEWFAQYLKRRRR